MRNFLVFFVGGSTGGLIFAGAGVRPAGKPRFLRYDKPRVGADSTAPAGAFRRPTGPQVRLLGRRYRPGLWRRRAPILKLPRCGGRERPPYGTGRTWRPTGKTRRRKIPGRAMALPYKPSEMPRQTGTAVTIRASVGRDALIPPHPAAAQTSAGGYGIRLYGQRQTPR